MLRNVNTLLRRGVYACRGYAMGTSGQSSISEVDRPKKIFKKLRGSGDKGESSLFTGERRPKDDPIFEALGAADELTSILGIVREKSNAGGLFDVAEKFAQIQCDIQDVCAHLATPKSSSRDALTERTKFDPAQVEIVNRWIDEYAENLPELTQFILPGGGELSATIHHARSVCRRTERRISSIIRSQQADPVVLRYVNRLSDLLFVLARHACFTMQQEEISYKKSRGGDQTNTVYKWRKINASKPDR